MASSKKRSEPKILFSPYFLLEKEASSFIFTIEIKKNPAIAKLEENLKKNGHTIKTDKKNFCKVK